MRLCKLSIALTTCGLMAALFAFTGPVSSTAKATAQVHKASNAPPYQWHQDPSPNVGTATNILLGISAGFTAGSAYDVWAVGTSNTTDSGGDTLIQRWNGNTWQIVPSPDQGSGSNILVSVEVVTGRAARTRDAWAVGSYYSGSNQYTLTEHWNGSAWSIVPSPNPSPNGGGNVLLDVSVVSRDDIWAVGTYNTPGNLNKTLVMHWNGIGWQIVPSPNAPGFNALGSVAAISSTDAWAIGVTTTSPSLANLRPLAMHWDGTGWSLVQVPMPGDATEGFLSSVAALGPNNVWAVGAYIGQDGLYHTLAIRWDGQRWSALPRYDVPGAAFHQLRGVGITKAGEVWATGWSATIVPPDVFALPRAYPGTATMILRWNNTAWEQVSSPTPGTGSLLMAMTVLGERAWAVGNSSNSSGPNTTLIESYMPPSFRNSPIDRLFSIK
ncbi:MAG TPA: hypothetical protein VGE45_09625 [Chloroflexia bacterium]